MYTQFNKKRSFYFMTVFWVLREKVRKRGYEIRLLSVFYHLAPSLSLWEREYSQPGMTQAQ